MPIKLLETDGINQIKASMAENKDAKDAWSLVLLDCTNIEAELKPSDIMSGIVEKMEHLNGMITQSSTSMITFLLEVGSQKNLNDTLHELNETLPAEFMCRISNRQENEGETTKVTCIIDRADSQIKKAPELDDPNRERGELFEKRKKRAEKRVLIADDDIFMRQLLNGTLKDAFAIQEVENGEAVVEAYLEYLPDIVLLDIHFPDTSGLEIIDKIIEADPDAYILMLSADSIKKNVHTAVERGAKGFITKPPQKDKLFEYIERCPTYTFPKKTVSA